MNELFMLTVIAESAALKTTLLFLISPTRVRQVCPGRLFDTPTPQNVCSHQNNKQRQEGLREYWKLAEILWK